MKYKPNLDEAVERMRRLWRLEPPLDRVPCAVRLPGPPPPEGKTHLKDGSFMGNVSGYLAFIRQVFERQAAVPDEWMPTVGAKYGHALISALCGSPIRWAAETTWSVPFIQDWSQVESLRLDFDNEWGVRFLADLAELMEWAAGKCAVEVYEIEGVSDTMAALRGTEQVCMDFYDAPDETRRFAHKVAGLLIEWGRWNLDHVAAKQYLLGGVSTGWCVWMPGGSVCLAEDGTVLYGREQYRTFIKEEDARLTGSFTHTLLEVHSEGNHQIPEFAEVDGITMMAIGNPIHMSPEDRAVVEPLFGRKAFYTGCKADELDDLLAITGTRGIYLSLRADSADEARDLLQHLETLTVKHRSE